MRYELKIALRYLRARRKDAFISITTIFTAVGVMIGVAALTMTLSVMGGFEQSIKERVLNLSPQVQILNSRGSIENYADIEKKVATVPGVNGAEAYIIGQAMLSSGRGIGGVVVRGVEPNNPVVRDAMGPLHDGGRSRRSRAQLHDSGRRRGARGHHRRPRDRSEPREETQGQAAATRFGWSRRLISPDGSLSTKSGQFVVGAIFDSGMNFIDTNMVFMNLTNAQDFFGRSAKVDGVDIHLVNLDQTDAVTDALTQMFPSPYRVQNWIEFNESAAAGFALLKRVYALVLVMLIGVAAFNLVATLIMVVMEKRKDIAVLIAMGATRRDVRLIFVLKGLIVGAAGTAAGLILGAAGCFALAHYQFIHIPREIYGISTLPIAVAPSNFAAVALASMLLCLLATVYPARQASREMPVEIFRS